MVQSTHNDIKISAIAVGVPSTWESLEEFSKNKELEEFNLKKFIKTTGVRGRYKAIRYQTTSDLCYAAAEKLLKEKNIDPSEIGLLVFVTQGPDYWTPATACVLQKRLRLSEDCIAFDVNMGCSGFVYGVNIASSVLINSNTTKALMLVGDVFARQFYPDNENKRVSSATRFLFGDAGAAVLLEKENGSKLQVFSCTDGDGYKSIIVPGMGWRHPFNRRISMMDDISVFNFAIEKAPEMLKAYMAYRNSTPADYEKLILHQANLLIMKQIAKRTGFPLEKLSISIDEFGNTSGASIPVSLVKDYGNNNDTTKRRFLTCGFGVGLSWAAMEIEISPSQILPLIRTDEYFKDGYPDER